MKDGLATSHYVILVRYDHKRKTLAGKNFAPKIGRAENLVTNGISEPISFLIN